MSDAQRLRDEIADDLLALRRIVSGTVAGGGSAAGDVRASLAHLLRTNPVWVLATAAGALAGLWVAAQGRRRKTAGRS